MFQQAIIKTLEANEEIEKLVEKNRKSQQRNRRYKEQNTNFRTKNKITEI